MMVLKVLGFVFLAVYLILVGLIGVAGPSLAFIPPVVIHLLAIVSGVLILVAVGKCCCSCDKCQK